MQPLAVIVVGSLLYYNIQYVELLALIKDLQSTQVASFTALAN